jgi:hypothetical protein
MRSLLKLFGSASTDRPAGSAAEAARARRSAAAAQPPKPPTHPLSPLQPMSPTHPLTPSGTRDWSQVRSPERTHDQALTELAKTWAASLPPRVRPVNLLELYPRVANRVALCWSDAVLMASLFEDLLMDKRGGRKGFPPLVATELKRLQQHHQNTTGSGSSKSHDPWAANSLAISDR